MNNIGNIWFSLSKKLLSFIRSKIDDEIVAEDILQEVFIKIHSKIDTLRDDTKIQPWIFQITRNQINDYFRKNKKDQSLNRFEIQFEEQNHSNEILEEALHDMITMMDALPPDYCEALCLTELNGLSQKEYAQRTGISYTAAKSRVQRSRKMLKDMLMRCCHYEFDKYGTVLDITPHACCCCQPVKSI
jgi:RNA polymerase sigma-70 factor (ECF subfamily)